MRKTMFVVAALVAGSMNAQAEGVMGWLDDLHAPASAPGGVEAQAVQGDQAALLTLEPGENEMYPKPSPDGQFLLTISSKGRNTWVSRRFVENGDPASVVTEDGHAFDSIDWRDAGHVYFFSVRAGGLGLWEKISDGEGMQRRLLTLRGNFTEPVLLDDGSIVAVHLNATAPTDRQHARTKTDDFDNWSMEGFSTELVHVSPDGDMRTLGTGINPSLSPDGKWIVFSMPVGRSYHLFRMHPDGSELIQVTDARSVDVQPSWSPDGKWIVFTSNREESDLRHKHGNNWDVWAIDPTGRNLTRLSSDDARDGGARVGADGRVYFHSDRKVDGALAEARDMRHAERGFHIWTLPLPSAAAAEAPAAEAGQ